jgi:hypothetical protein
MQWGWGADFADKQQAFYWEGYILDFTTAIRLN